MREAPEGEADRPDPVSVVLDELRGSQGRYHLSRLPPGWSLRFGAVEGCVFHALAAGPGRLSDREPLSPTNSERSSPSVEVALDSAGRRPGPEPSPAPAWLWVGGEAAELVEGELVVLPHGDAHTIGLHPRGRPVRFSAEPGRIEDWTRGGPVAAELVCGLLVLRESRVHPLLRSLPRVLRVPGDGAIGAVLALLRGEAQRPGDGGAALVARLFEVLALHAVRAWAARPDAAPSWVAGALDPDVGRAIAEIHRDPGGRFTVERLARLAGMSRSRFAARFRALVGVAPAAYVRGVRLRAAAAALADGGRVSSAAHAGGYGSAAAFSRAFKRATGVAPRSLRPRG